MHPRLVESLTLPLLHRRTWPRVRAALARLREVERMPADEVRRRSEEAALRTARAAAERSPFLRGLYASCGVRPHDLRTADDLRRLPVLTREMLRGHADEIVSEGADRADLVRGATGGSTGVPTPYFHDTTWWCHASAAAMRGDEWTGWRIGERHATVWGTPVGESRRRAAARRMSERMRNFLFLPGFDLAADRADAHLDRLDRFRPRLVSGYASILVALALRRIERGPPSWRPRAVLSCAEPLRADDRVLVERAFGAPVFDRYGSREVGFVAQECREHDGLHVATEHVFLEIDADGRPAPPGGTGRVLATVLDNASFPLVRYDLGDLATAGDGTPCPCGLPLPRLARVDGRQADVLRTACGGTLTGLFFPHVVKEHPWVAAFQVVQDERGDVEIRIVPDASVARGNGAERLVSCVREAMGEGLEVRLRFVDRLERTPSGKVRLTRSAWRPPAAARTPAGEPA